MKVEMNVQGESFRLKTCIEEEIEKKPKKAYFLIGNLKDSGMDILEEMLIDTNIKTSIYVAYDKKSTTKMLLERVYKLFNERYVYNNNDEIEFKCGMYIFETDKEATIITSPASFSEDGMDKTLTIVSKVTYNLKNADEAKEYKAFIKSCIPNKNEKFKVLTKTFIKELVEEKQIFSSKQYEHSIKSISEFLSESKKKNQENNTLASQSAEDIKLDTPKINTDIELDFDLETLEEDVDENIVEESVKENEIQEEKDEKDDIGFDDDSLIEEYNDEILAKIDESQDLDFEDEEIEETSSEVIDLEDMLFTKANVKLDERGIETSKKNEIVDEDYDDNYDKVVKSKKIILNNVTTFLFESSGKQQNGQDLDLIKIPNYISKLIPEFFSLNTMKKEMVNGVEYTSKKVTLEIISVKENLTIKDTDALITHRKGQTYFCFSSEKFVNLDYENFDIIRISKIKEESYKIEFISKELPEYDVWKKAINQKFKASDRMYGIL